MRQSLVLLVACALFLAGCASQAPTDPFETMGTVNAAPEPAATPAEPADPTVEAFAHDGKLGTHAEVCVYPVDLCKQFGAEAWIELPLPERTLGASITATWEATTPLTEEIAVAIYRIQPCQDDAEDCIDGQRLDFPVNPLIGPSPLTLAAAWDTIVPGETIIFGVSGHGTRTPATYTRLLTDQPFHLEGTLLREPPGGGA